MDSLFGTTLLPILTKDQKCIHIFFLTLALTESGTGCIHFSAPLSQWSSTYFVPTTSCYNSKNQFLKFANRFEDWIIELCELIFSPTPSFLISACRLTDTQTTLFLTIFSLYAFVNPPACHLVNKPSTLIGRTLLLLLLLDLNTTRGRRLYQVFA